MRPSAVILCSVLSLAVAPAGYAQSDVVIGTASPLSGPGAHLGKDIENGARMAIVAFASATPMPQNALIFGRLFAGQMNPWPPGDHALAILVATNDPGGTEHAGIAIDDELKLRIAEIEANRPQVTEAARAALQLRVEAGDVAAASDGFGQRTRFVAGA